MKFYTRSNFLWWKNRSFNNYYNTTFFYNEIKETSNVVSAVDWQFCCMCISVPRLWVTNNTSHEYSVIIWKKEKEHGMTRTLFSSETMHCQTICFITLIAIWCDILCLFVTSTQNTHRMEHSKYGFKIRN